MKGKLYGVGVGPGDPELITLKAVKTIENCNYIAVPNEIKENAVSYNIALSAIPNIKKKNCLCISMPMTKDKNILTQSHQKAVQDICNILDTGSDIAFLTLGDPTIYSTYIYIHEKVEAAGYETEIINGIPSFCAAASLINKGLVTGSEILNIVPSSYGIDKALASPGTKVLMKAGRKVSQIKDKLSQKHVSVTMVENCGMKNEHIYNSIEDIPDNPSYYSIIIVKEDKSNG